MLQVQVMGHLGRDAEVRENGAGNKFITFGIAVNETYTENGQEIKRTEWIDVVANHSGVAPYLKKGTLVFVQGRGKTELFSSKKDGSTQAKIKVRASIVQLCGSARDETSVAPAVAQPVPVAPPVTAPAVPSQAALGGFNANNNDDLPF